MSLHSVVRRLRTTYWAVADQLLISCVNLITILVVARHTSRDEFGVFALAYGVVLFANDIQSAVLTQPHNIIGAPLTGNDYAKYTGASTAAQAGLTAVLAIVGLAAAALLQVLGVGTGAAETTIALTAAVCTAQFQEFFRRVYYTERRFRAAFLNDLVSYGGQAVALLVLGICCSLTAQTALYVLAATSMAALVVESVDVYRRFDYGSARDALRSNWHLARWLLPGAVLSWLSVQFYTYASAVILGAAAAAILRAADLLLRPLNLLLVVLDNLLLVQFSRRWAITSSRSGEGRAQQDIRLAYLLTSPIALAYCAAVAAFGESLLRITYGGRYDGYGTLVAILALFYAVRYASHIISISLRSRGIGRPSFEGPLYAGAVTVTVGVVAIVVAGVYGAAFGMLLSAVVVALVRWMAYRRYRRSFQMYGGGS